MRFDLLHPADQLVMTMNRIYRKGMTTTTGGNLSVRDKNGDIWITPSGVDKGSLTRSDIVCVKPDGEVVGIHKPSVELPFHSTVYRLRPDINAIVHAHPPVLVAYSLTRSIPDTRLMPGLKELCGDIAITGYEVPGSAKLSRNISCEFEKGYNAVIMENHGAVCGGPDMEQAFMAFEALEFVGQVQIGARKLGTPRPLEPEQLKKAGFAQPSLGEFEPERPSSEECEARRDLCALIHRAYDQQLFSAAHGVFSQRLTDGSMLITPHGKDRLHLDPEDLVLVRGNECEPGKTPDFSLPLHQEVYARHPEIGSVVMACPQGIMSFACSDVEFDSSLISEGYIILRHVKSVPFASFAQDIEGTAKTICDRSPVLVAENQGVIATGATALNAFDRLEVLEYSARPVLNAYDIGPLMHISPEGIREINETYNLPM